MFKSLIAKFKEAVEIQEARSMLPYTMAFRSSEFMGYGVYESDRIVFAITGVRGIPNALVIPAQRQIFVNKEFLESSEEIKNAMLLHEVAHIELGHKAGPFNMLQTTLGFGKGIRQELEADEWAFNKGGDVTPVLQNFLKNHSSIGTHTRLAALSKLKGEYDE